ncbi:MAG TPA: hypothetical protein VL754_10170 [Verrucomicrobiae bacterium]|nr:hypothetical protein [Verrucomicrobiae bacterium]
MLTLRKINRHLDYTDGERVKISRLSVKATILATRWTRQNDALLRLLFSLAATGLPLSPVSPACGEPAASSQSPETI